MVWEPDAYPPFHTQASVAFGDLVRLIRVRAGLQVLHVGCGTGSVTSRLAVLLPESDILGIDSSPHVLALATQRTRPGLRFALQAIADTTGEWDLVVSSGVLHTLDEHHKSLMSRLLALVRPGGQLVVEFPSDQNTEFDAILRGIATEGQFRFALDGGWIHQSWILRLEQYAVLLYDHGGTDLTVYEKVYPMLLEHAAMLVDERVGTALALYLERLPETLAEPFIERYRAAVRDRYGAGPLFYPLRRIVLAATRALP